MEKESKETAFANVIASCWIEKKFPTSKGCTINEELQEFKRAAIEKLLKEKPSMIHNGNIFFKGLPHAPAFPWMFWTYVDWENFRIITRDRTTNPFENST